jgi:hypothetical protein
VAKDRISFEKRQRETRKRQKAEEKRTRRQKRKDFTRGAEFPEGGQNGAGEQGPSLP